MRVLLTGAAGFIGSHVATRLLSRGDTVVGLDCFDETLYPAALHQRNVDAIVPGPAAGMELVRGDLTSENTLDSLFASHRFDAVVHLGALAGVRPSLHQPLRYEHVNVRGTLLVLETMRRHEVGRLACASSSSVYGARNEVPFRETDPAVHPASPYAATKRAGELVCDTYASLYGQRIASLRFFTVYGPRQRPEMAIAAFARHILDGTPLPFFGDGTTARDYTYIDDIVDGVVAALDSTAEGGATDGHLVYNLGGSRVTTLLQLVALLEDALGKKAVLDRRPLQPGDVPITYADCTRAEQRLGYLSRVPIEEGIARYCAWLRG
ncbi:MAG: NAD-dependent epimerase/dehydratase family protein [Polyangia bacterium]